MAVSKTDPIPTKGSANANWMRRPSTDGLRCRFIGNQSEEQHKHQSQNAKAVARRTRRLLVKDGRRCFMRDVSLPDRRTSLKQPLNRLSTPARRVALHCSARFSSGVKSTTCSALMTSRATESSYRIDRPSHSMLFSPVHTRPLNMSGFLQPFAAPLLDDTNELLVNFANHLPGKLLLLSILRGKRSRKPLFRRR